jgi:hypothetical protein
MEMGRREPDLGLIPNCQLLVGADRETSTIYLVPVNVAGFVQFPAVGNCADICAWLRE